MNPVIQYWLSNYCQQPEQTFREELSLNTLPPFAFPISCSPSGKYIPSSLVQLPKAYFPNVFLMSLAV